MCFPSNRPPPLLPSPGRQPQSEAPASDSDSKCELRVIVAHNHGCVLPIHSPPECRLHDSGKWTYQHTVSARIRPPSLSAPLPAAFFHPVLPTRHLAAVPVYYHRQCEYASLMNEHGSHAPHCKLSRNCTHSLPTHNASGCCSRCPR